MAARKDNGARPQDDAWIENTRLFKALTEIETEIMEHRWAEMKKTGREMDWDRAVVDWTIHCGHRLNRRKK